MKRIIIGQRGSDYGLWISKPGADATSTDDQDFLVSPARALSQPIMTGYIYAAPNTGSGTGPGSKNTSNTMVSLTITHGLGFVPVVAIFGYYTQGGVDTAAFATVDTSQVQIFGLADNSFKYSGAGAPSGTYYFPVSVSYAIYVNQLSAS